MSILTYNKPRDMKVNLTLAVLFTSVWLAFAFTGASANNTLLHGPPSSDWSIAALYVEDEVPISFSLNSPYEDGPMCIVEAEEQVSLCPDITGVEYLPAPLEHARRTSLGPIMMGTHTSGNATSREAREMREILEEERVQAIVAFHPSDSDITEEFENSFVYMHDLYETRHTSYWNFHWWMDYDPNWMDPLLDLVEEHGLEHIVIHCQHGVDRTGNAMAFLMAVHCNVPINEAWYAVVNHRQHDLDGLFEVLQEFGYEDEWTLEDPRVSIFSNHENGMKAHNSSYQAYIQTSIQGALDRGARL